MDLIDDDVGRGDWLADRLRGAGRVGSVAGYGAEAYARLLHPVPSGVVDQRREWGVPPSDDWRTRRWAVVAAEQGRTMHPLVQSGRLFDDQDPNAPGSSVGWLDPVVLAALVPLLARATTTPGDVVAAFWVGSGGLDLVAAPRSVLAGREHLLARTDLEELAGPDWGHGLELGWLPHVRAPSVQLLWPEDHAWVLATEVDWDSTIVAGSRRLVDDVLADGRFEAYEVGADDELTWHGDAVDGPPAG